LGNILLILQVLLIPEFWLVDRFMSSIEQHVKDKIVDLFTRNLDFELWLLLSALRWVITAIC